MPNEFLLVATEGDLNHQRRSSTADRSGLAHIGTENEGFYKISKHDYDHAFEILKKAYGDRSYRPVFLFWIQIQIHGEEFVSTCWPRSLFFHHKAILRNYGLV